MPLHHRQKTMHKTSQQRLKQGERERERERNSLESTHRGSETEESKSSSKQQNKKLMERTPFISPTTPISSPLQFIYRKIPEPQFQRLNLFVLSWLEWDKKNRIYLKTALWGFELSANLPTALCLGPLSLSHTFIFKVPVLETQSLSILSHNFL